MKIIITQPVEKFILSLNNSLKQKISRYIATLQKHGYKASMPLTRKMSNNLFELRIAGNVQVRIFYTIVKGEAWLVHAFVKTTQRTPKQHLALATKRAKSLTVNKL